ncbi:MAG: insulinase family protein, partial [Flavitalea sp.]
VTQEDIDKYKGGIQSQLINGLQSVSGKVSQLAAFETFTGNPNKISELLKMYTSVTKEDVMRVYNEYIKGKKAVILSVLPKGQEKLIAATDNYKIDSSNYDRPDYGYAGLKYNKPTDNFERKKMPGNGANPAIKVPAFWRKDMANGIRVIGSETNELPTITMTLTLKGGHLLQANDTSKVGLAGMFATMMNDDTKNYTSEQMAVELQKLGSSINVSSGLDGITFSVQSLKQNFDKTLALLEERISNPSFKQAAFQRYQKQLIESIKQSKTQPAAVANAVFAKVLYGPDNILGMDDRGTENTVKNLELSDVENYYKNYISSDGARLVVVGDIKQQEFLSKLGFLSKLPNKKINLPKPAPAIAANGLKKVYVVDVPKAAQTEFRVGYLTGLKYDGTGDYFKSTLANFALGGGFNGRVNINLREDKGWTYGARTGFDSDEYGGTFEFSSGIRADATDSALAEVVKDIKEYAATGIREDELVFMKNAIGQRDALRYETGFQKAGFISRILEYNLPANYADQQSKILKAITKKEIDAIAKARMNIDKMQILLVGDKAKIMEGVKKLGYEVEELTADAKPAGKKAF